MKKLFLLSPFFMALFLSCSNDSTIDLVEQNNEDFVKYSTHVKSIIDNNCLACHQNPPVNFAPNHLTTYEAVKEAVQNRGLIDRVSRAQGDSGLMPAGGTRLPQATIDLLIQWETDGFQE